MEIEEINKIIKSLDGASVPKPRGTMAGHAAGLPFESLVHKALETQIEGLAVRQFEFLNQLMEGMKNRLTGEDLTETQTVNEFLSCLGKPSSQLLLKRGIRSVSSWTRENQFLEKQNDTAETILLRNSPYSVGDHLTFLDVKTRNVQLEGQPPNIISAQKLANSLHQALLEGEVLFDFVYVGIDWVVNENHLESTASRTISLFKIKQMPYINWTAAQQIQFDVASVDQDFQGSREDWSREYLGHVWRSLITSQKNKKEKFKKFEPYA
jgi:type II restriction enzyme